MTLDPQSIADRLGAIHVCHVPDTGGGAFGMARLAAVLKERLQTTPGSRSGQPSNVRWVLRGKVPMSRETEAQLILMAEKMSSPERRISPMQVAAQLLEETIQRIAQHQSP